MSNQPNPPQTTDFKFPKPTRDLLAVYPLPAHADDSKGLSKVEDHPYKDFVNIYTVDLDKLQQGLAAGILLAKGDQAEVEAEVHDIVYYPSSAIIDLKGFHYIQSGYIIAFEPNA